MSRLKLLGSAIIGRFTPLQTFGIGRTDTPSSEKLISADCRIGGELRVSSITSTKIPCAAVRLCPSPSEVYDSLTSSAEAMLALQGPAFAWRRRVGLQLARSSGTFLLSSRHARTITEVVDPAGQHAAEEIPEPQRVERATAAQLRRYKPRTPGVRHLVRPVNDHLWKGRPHHPLTYPRKGHGIGGRNATGQVTVRHRGGGAKRRIRVVDFDRNEPGEHVVERIEYDPGRSAHIALLYKRDTPKQKSYIVAPDGMRPGDVVQSYRAGIPQELIDSIGSHDPALIAARTALRGNCLPLHMIPAGTVIFNIGLRRNRGAQMCRSAGTYGTVVTPPDAYAAKFPKHVLVKLQSGEIRRIPREACATIGMASNVNHHLRQLGKAGRSRNLGIRPTVRGVAMNANEHPHGGGRGKSKGNRHPVSKWGRTLVSPLHTSAAAIVLTLSRPRADSRPARRGTSIGPSSRSGLATSGDVDAITALTPCTDEPSAAMVAGHVYVSMHLYPRSRESYTLCTVRTIYCITCGLTAPKMWVVDTLSPISTRARPLSVWTSVLR